jgi:hypothetical protein
MVTTSQPVQAQTRKKKVYTPPQVRSERILVPDLFTPSCIPDETPC